MKKQSAIRINILDTILIRIASESFDELKYSAIEYKNLIDRINQKRKLQLQIQNNKLYLTNILFGFIADISDYKIKLELIKLKRSIYNDRLINKETILKLQKYLSEDIITTLNSYLILQQNILDIENEIKFAYDNAINIDFSTIRNFCTKENFQNGLLLSSIEMFNLSKRLKHNSTIDKSTAIGFHKYITRMVAKTSPFSSFTNISTANREYTGTKIINSIFIDNKITSKVRYNSNLLEVFTTLIKGNPNLCQNSILKLNSTLRKNKNYYRFLINERNIESFKKIESNKILNSTITFFKKSNRILFKDLVQLIMSTSNFNNIEANGYIIKLIQVGMLEIDFEFSGFGDFWDISLQEFFKNKQKEFKDAKHISDIFLSLRKLREAFEISPSQKRETILSEMKGRILTVLNLLQKGGLISTTNASNNSNLGTIESSNSIKSSDNTNSIENSNYGSYKLEFEEIKCPKNLIYEDTFRELNLQINRFQLDELIKKLDAFLRETSIKLNFSVKEKEIKDFYFKMKPSEKGLNFFEFYEKYSLGKIKNKEKALNNHDKEIKNSFLTLNESILKSLVLLFKKEYLIGQLYTRKNTLHLNKTVLDKLKYLADEKTSNDQISYGILIQLFEDKDIEGKPILRGVLNNVFPGYGKLLSRFLYLINDSSYKDIYKINKKLNSFSEMHCENVDASNFNGNIHPPLMPFEIEIPGGHNKLPQGRRINIKDINIRFNLTSEKLELFHAHQNRRIFFHDLGFQSLMGRSNLFQLLSNFSYGDIGNYRWILSILNTIHPRIIVNSNYDSKVIIYPRIVYEELIVIQRLKWVIPFETFPKIENKCKDWEVFTIINDWRISLAIPDEIFFTIGSKYDYAERRGNENSLSTHKPQYINFCSPLSVALFRQKIIQIKEALIIEEMLPKSKNLIKIGVKRYTTEFSIQWQSH